MAEKHRSNSGDTHQVNKKFDDIIVESDPSKLFREERITTTLEENYMP